MRQMNACCAIIAQLGLRPRLGGPGAWLRSALVYFSSHSISTFICFMYSAVEMPLGGLLSG